MTRRRSDGMPVAGNGLLDRRGFLRSGLQSGLGAAAGLTLMQARPVRGSDRRPEASPAPGAALSPYGSPAPHEADVQRVGFSLQPGTTGSGSSRTPLERLEGILTPNGLHFERHHGGVPEIDPDLHDLTIHGLVDRPLAFSMDALARYPLVSRLHFLECSGNSGALVAPEPIQGSCGELNGLLSCSEWTGVPLSILLDEAGVRPEARWIIAEGADAPLMARSVPLEKALDDAIVALYQNGERLRPENGYPIRLFLPGYEGNTNVKWLRRIEVQDRPAMTRDETSKYTELQTDGRAALFTFRMGVKSVITSPAPGLEMGGPGLYPISGLAWSGAGAIRRVEVSADGGRSWGEAALDEPVLPRCLSRFRMAWRWDGSPSLLLSRAVDTSGDRQPTRDELMAGRAPGTRYHYNAVQAWRVAASGAISHAHVDAAGV